MSVQRCLACGEVLRYRVKRYREGITRYCGRECWEARPPKLAALCDEHGMEPAALLQSWLSKHSENLTAQLLGVQNNTLRKWRQKLGV